MELQPLKKIIEESDNIVFFGGAGVSTESGIPDFRSADGLYETESGGKYAPEQILSYEFFIQHPKEFYQFYIDKMIYTDVKPNLAHQMLAELEKRGNLKAIITQNIDGLHQQAGSQKVLELHGSIHRNYCMTCKQFYPLEYILKHKNEVPICEKCGGIVKPDVVLYQESLDQDVLSQSVKYISEADVLIVGGTSLQVYPAAGLIEYYNGNKMILINKSPTPYDSRANYLIPESIGKVMQALLA